MFIIRTDRSHLGLFAVAQNNESVEVEQMRDGVFVVAQIFVVGAAQVFVGPLQLWVVSALLLKYPQSNLIVAAVKNPSKLRKGGN